MPEFCDIRQYWEWAHETNNMSSLTGDTLVNHLDVLGARMLLRRDQNVLCIGVGDGVWVHELAEFLNGAGSITALDISGTARARVAKIASALSPETFYRMQPRDCFDLALSLWVSPHMKTAMVAAQFQAVIPALTGAGVFAVHYNEPIDGLSYEEASFIARYSTEAEALRSGQMRIARTDFLDIVHHAGGRVLDWPLRQESPDYGEVICTAHVVRGNGSDGYSRTAKPLT